MQNFRKIFIGRQSLLTAACYTAKADSSQVVKVLAFWSGVNGFEFFYFCSISLLGSTLLAAVLLLKNEARFYCLEKEKKRKKN